MTKQKSEFVSATGTTFEIVKGLAEEIWAIGGNDDSLRRIISDRSLRQNIARLIVGENANGSGTYKVTVDYGQSLDTMITAGRYDWKNGDINDQNFPISGRRTSETEIALFHFNKGMSTDAVLAELDKRGFRAATLPELLALGADQPELQRQFPIIALGSVWRDPIGIRCVAYLDGSGAERYLNLYWYGRDWKDICRFAAVRKSS